MARYADEVLMSVGRDPVAPRLGEQFEQVLAAAQAGAPWALERLWQELSPVVAGYLRVQGATEPEDLTSDAFLAAFKGLRSFSGGEAQFRSWVFTIAHHRLTDERRRAARRPVRVDGDVPELASGDVEEEAARRMATERVRRLCEGLVADQRDVLLLRMLADLTIDDIAEALGKTPGAVKALQRRGLAAIRRQMERQGVPL